MGDGSNGAVIRVALEKQWPQVGIPLPPGSGAGVQERTSVGGLALRCPPADLAMLGGPRTRFSASPSMLPHL